VPGGTYSRKYTNSGDGPTEEADPASVSPFRLDKYLVTVGRFRQFASAWSNGTGWTPPAGSGKHTSLNGGQGLANSGSHGSYEPGWVLSDDIKIALPSTGLECGSDQITWTASPTGLENSPVNCVNWWTADAFCIWDGGFLPSEAEFGYVAAGGSQQREYPWGSAEPGTRNQYAIYNCYYPNAASICSAITALAPVGTTTLGAGLWNQLDLAGEVYEWTLDWYAPYVDPCTDCAYLAPSPTRAMRGGGVFQSIVLPSSERNDVPPTEQSPDLGFRCARSP